MEIILHSRHANGHVFIIIKISQAVQTKCWELKQIDCQWDRECRLLYDYRPGFSQGNTQKKKKKKLFENSSFLKPFRKTQGFVPQILKQVVNLSCCFCKTVLTLTQQLAQYFPVWWLCTSRIGLRILVHSKLKVFFWGF